MTVENRKHSSKHWHSGKMRCGVCDWSYILNINYASVTRTLLCENRRNNGTEITVADNGRSYGCANKGINEQVLLLSLEHILQQIGHTRDEVISDLLCEITAMQKKSTSADVASLESEIEKLNTKKRNSIDLMLEGLISKDDLKKQTEFYDNEIARLTEEIHQSKDIGNAHARQIKKVREYIDKVKETADITEYNTDIYRELLDRIMVNGDNTIDVFLNCVPFGFKVAYTTAVRKKKFIVTIDSCSIIA